MKVSWSFECKSCQKYIAHGLGVNTHFEGQRICWDCHNQYRGE